MTVATKSVTNRRQIRYETYDNLLSDAEALAAGEIETIGNWSYGQILEHISATMCAKIDGFSFRGPLPLRIIMKLFMMSKFLNKGLPAGFSIPKKAEHLFKPDDGATTDAGMEFLRSAIERTNSEPATAEHPFLGPLTPEEWQKFDLRHAELHMSFVRPAGE
jgi:hypothetical protein